MFVGYEDYFRLRKIGGVVGGLAVAVTSLIRAITAFRK